MVGFKELGLVNRCGWMCGVINALLERSWRVFASLPALA